MFINNDMIYITQLIYLIEGQENIFNQFEDVAIPIIAKYNGKLLLRIRPNQAAVVEVSDIELPYEIHLVSFNSEEDFESFTRDEERKNFLHLKEQSIRSVLVIEGNKV